MQLAEALRRRSRATWANLLGPRLHFGRAGGVLVGSGSLPAGLLEGKLHGHGLSVLGDDVRAGLHTRVAEEGSRFVHLGIPELVGIVQRSAWVDAGSGARLGASISSGAVRVPARSAHGHSTFLA